MKYGRHPASKKRDRTGKWRRESFYQSQDVMTVLVFYCHITNYLKLYNNFKLYNNSSFKITHIYCLIASGGQKFKHNWAGFSASGIYWVVIPGVGQGCGLIIGLTKERSTSKLGAASSCLPHDPLYRPTSLASVPYQERVLCMHCSLMMELTPHHQCHIIKPQSWKWHFMILAAFFWLEAIHRPCPHSRERDY